MANDTPKRIRKPRKNYAKKWEELEFYVRTILRIKEPGVSADMHPSDPSEFLKGQVHAYRDLLDYMQGGAK